MTPYKDDIFRELKTVLANAKAEKIEKLLSDIAHGEFIETAQTRAGDNDNHFNVTNIDCIGGTRKVSAPRQASRTRYTS